MKCVLALGLAAVVAAPPAVAEDTTVAEGHRVRVTTSSGRLVGRLVGIDGDSLQLALAKGSGTEPLTLRRAEVLRLEMSVRPSRRGMGVQIGFLAGVVAAVAIGLVAGEDCPSPAPNTLQNFSRNLDAHLCIDQGEMGLLSALVTLPVGVLVGAAVAPGEKWRLVGVDQLTMQPRISRARGVGLEVAIGF